MFAHSMDLPPLWAAPSGALARTSQALGASTSMYRMRNIRLQPSQSSTRSIHSAMLSLPRGLIWCRPAHDVVFLKQSQFCSPQKDFSHRRWEVPTSIPSTPTHQFTLRGIIFSTGKGDKTAQITLAFYLGLSWQPSQAEQHWSILSVIRTTAIFQDIVSQVSRKPHLSLRQCCLSRTHFSSRTLPTLLWTQSHQTTDVSACPQHRLLRKENGHQKLVYALTALALKSTSWTRNVYCAHLPTSSSLITGTRLIPSQLQITGVHPMTQRNSYHYLVIKTQELN